MSPRDRLAAHVETEQEQGRLRQALGLAHRQLAEAKAQKRDLVDAVYRAARDSIATLDLPPVPAPRSDRRTSKTPEVAIAGLGDWQLAKVTPSYNSKVCEQRIERMAEKVMTLAEIQRSDHPVRECRVNLVGDLVEGEMIFPGQAHRIDASLYRQVLVDGPRILGGFLRSMLATFERVHVTSVIGNHGSLGGRARKEYHPETNADAMLYEVTRQLLATEERLTWAPNMIAGERRWYAIDRVGSKGFLLFHGDQVRGGFAGFPWYGFGKRISGWRNGAIAEPFDYAISGHFHTVVKGKYGKVTHWGVGSTESDNTYAQEELAASSDPTQLLLFSHPARGVTAEYEVALS